MIGEWGVGPVCWSQESNGVLTLSPRACGVQTDPAKREEGVKVVEADLKEALEGLVG